jgi:nitrous oxidase accessory protein NosD
MSRATVVVTDNEIVDAKPCILADGNHKKIIKRNRCRNSPIRILNKKGSKIKDNIITQDIKSLSHIMKP